MADYRRPFVDFSIPYRQGSVSFMIGTKFATESQHFAISDTSLPLIGLLFLIAFALSNLIGIVVGALDTNRNHNYDPFWTIYQTFVLKSIDDRSLRTGQKLLVTVWLFAGILTVAIIGGNLLSMLTYQPVHINTLKKLAKADHLKIITTPHVLNIVKVTNCSLVQDKLTLILYRRHQTMDLSNELHNESHRLYYLKSLVIN